VRASGWLARVYFWLIPETDRRRVRRDGTSLCALVGRPLGFALFLGGVLALVGVGVVKAVSVWRELLVVALLILAAVLVVLTVRFVVLGTIATETGALVGAWLAAKKRRVCPLVEFVDDVEVR